MDSIRGKNLNIVGNTQLVGVFEDKTLKSTELPNNVCEM